MSLTPLAEALRTELRRLLDGDDFSAKTCARIVDFAKSARTMLQATSGMAGAMDTLDQAVGMDTNYSESYDGSLTVGLGGGGFQALSGAPRAETFGAKVIQEIVALLPKLLEHRAAPTPILDPLSLVQAIKSARDGGMGDVAELLDRKLRALVGDPDTAAPEQPVPADPSVPLEQLQTQGTVKLTPHEIATLQEIRVATSAPPRSFALFQHEPPHEVPYSGPPLGGSTTTMPVGTTTILPSNAQGIPCAPEGSYALEGFDGVPLATPAADALHADDGVLRRSDLSNRDSCSVCGLPVSAEAKVVRMKPYLDDLGRYVLLDGQPVHNGCISDARPGSHVTTRNPSSAIDDYLSTAAQGLLHKEGT